MNKVKLTGKNYFYMMIRKNKECYHNSLSVKLISNCLMNFNRGNSSFSKSTKTTSPREKGGLRKKCQWLTFSKSCKIVISLLLPFSHLLNKNQIGLLRGKRSRVKLNNCANTTVWFKPKIISKIVFLIIKMFHLKKLIRNQLPSIGIHRLLIGLIIPMSELVLTWHRQKRLLTLRGKIYQEYRIPHH